MIFCECPAQKNTCFHLVTRSATNSFGPCMLYLTLWNQQSGVFCLFSRHIQVNVVSRKMITLESEDVREGKLLRTIKLHSMNYGVGPLDFCGVGDVITLGRKQSVLLFSSIKENIWHFIRSCVRFVGLCFGDPALSEWQRHRLRRSALARNKWKPGIVYNNSFIGYLLTVSCMVRKIQIQIIHKTT